MVGSLIGLHQGKTPPKQTRQTLNHLEENCCVRATPEGKLRGQLKWRELVALWPARG